MMLLPFACAVSWVIDGDTFVCRSGQHVRLAGIDAPELAGHCHARVAVGRDGRVRRIARRCTAGNAKASLHNLIRIAKGRTARCEDVGRSYDRVLAFCSVPVAGAADSSGAPTHANPARMDLACAQLTGGYAARRYSFGPMVCRR